MDQNEEDKLRSRLNSEEERRLNQPASLTSFQREKLEREAKKNWDLFYKRNGDRFFKNRYWTSREFSELFVESTAHPQATRYLLEIGCGCGDFVLPLLDNRLANDGGEGASSRICQPLPPVDLFTYCCDISDEAIEILTSNSIYKRFHPHRVEAFVADIVSDLTSIQKHIGEKLMDYVSLVFILSALDPKRMKQAIWNMHKLMKPGGMILFRDYAIYDKAMLRFSEKSKICDQFYVRQDGTRAYFFTKKQLLDLFITNQLFDCRSIEYVHRETLNNATKDKHSRIFLQAKFVCNKSF